MAGGGGVGSTAPVNANNKFNTISNIHKRGQGEFFLISSHFCLCYVIIDYGDTDCVTDGLREDQGYRALPAWKTIIPLSNMMNGSAVLFVFLFPHTILYIINRIFFVPSYNGVDITSIARSVGKGLLDIAFILTNLTLSHSPLTMAKKEI